MSRKTNLMEDPNIINDYFHMTYSDDDCQIPTTKLEEELKSSMQGGGGPMVVRHVYHRDDRDELMGKLPEREDELMGSLPENRQLVSAWRTPM